MLRRALGKPIIVRADRTGAPQWMAMTPLTALIAPHSIEESALRIRCGDSWMALLEGQTLPNAMSFAWLTSMQALDRRGVTVFWRYRAISDRDAMRMLSASESAGRETLRSISDAGAADIESSQGVEDIVRLRADIANGRDRLGHLHFVIAVAAPTPDALDRLVEDVRRSAATSNVRLDPTPFDQAMAYRLLLFGSSDSWESPVYRFDTCASVCASMGPVIIGPPQQPRMGTVIWGVHARTGEPVLWDRRQASNPHALVIASSGSGKTYAVRALLAQEAVTSDERIFIIDPKMREYRELTAALGGSYITLSSDGGASINPFELPRLSPARLQAAQNAKDRFLPQQGAMIRALIVQELAHYGMRLSPREYAILEQAILEAYAERGITDDPQTFFTTMPTFSDVQRLLADVMPGVAAALDIFTMGTLGSLINRPSSISCDSQVTALDTSPLLASDDPVLTRVIPTVVMYWVVNRALSVDYGAHIVADEAHVIIGHESGMRVMERIFRIGRSLGIKATVITQSIQDVHHATARILSENAATKLLLGVSADAARVIASALSLPDEAMEYLSQCRLVPGVGSYALLVAESHMTPLLIRKWEEPLHRIASGLPVR